MHTLSQSPFFSYSLEAKKGSMKKKILLLGGSVCIIILLVIGGYLIGKNTQASSNQVTSIAVDKPYFSKDINRDFSFPVKDAKGNTVATITYTIESANLQNQIILQGQRADAVTGRTFLIFNVKILNPSTQNIQINTRDFIRVTVDNSNELLAPEIHNDPVDIQPISTKYTRIGLPIDTTVTSVTLHVGEIDGTKTPITIPLKE